MPQRRLCLPKPVQMRKRKTTSSSQHLSMDFVPYVCPWASHFLLIGHFAGGFVSSPRMRLVPVNKSRSAATKPFRHQIQPLTTYTIPKKRSKNILHLQRAGCFVGYLNYTTRVIDCKCPKWGEFPKTATGA
jgi:hypothetical protein